MIAFCAVTHVAVSGEVSSSSQRYGSATLTPKYVSTWSDFRVSGYRICCAVMETASVARAKAAARRTANELTMEHP